MIVKDSTTNQVHNDSKNTKQNKNILRLRTDASESGAPPVEQTSQIHDRHKCRRLARLRGVVSDFISHFFGLDSFQKIAICNNKKEDLGEILFFE